MLKGSFGYTEKEEQLTEEILALLKKSALTVHEAEIVLDMVKAEINCSVFI